MSEKIALQSSSENLSALSVWREKPLLKGEHEGVCGRLRLPAGTPWEQIQAETDSNLLIVLRAEFHMGTTVQNRRWEKAYNHAQAIWQSEGKKFAYEPFRMEIDILVAQYNEETFQQLHSINTKSEALASDIRKKANADAILVHNILKDAELLSDATETQLMPYYDFLNRLNRARGRIRNDVCEHD
jgi:hypothetical protein